MYKCLHGNGPEYLKDLFSCLLVICDPKLSLRSATNSIILVEPKTKLSTGGDRSFQKGGPKLWNRLPHKLRACKSLNQFKTHLKTFLYNRVYS